MLIDQHEKNPAHFPTDQCRALEHALRKLYIRNFPKAATGTQLDDPPQLSISSRIWQARREDMAITHRTISDIFRTWKCICTYARLHRPIKQVSRQNKKNRLEQFLQDSAPFDLQYNAFDWHK